MLTQIIEGILELGIPFNFFSLFMGVFIGIVFGALPGLTGPMALALFVPLTYGMGVIPALLFLVGIYNGSVYGGSITAILLKIPGDPGNAATVFDGYVMAQNGEAGKALGYSALCSALGGIFSGIVLLFLAPALARAALSFGPAEYFSLAFMGLCAISGLAGGNLVKSLMSCVTGLLLACVGADEITGTYRMTFGTRFLMDGVQFVPALIGLFAFTEIFLQIVKQSRSGELIIKKASTKLPSFKEMWGHRFLMLKTAIIGTWIGILPGTGATLANFMGYAEALRSSKHPEQFGKGSPEGIVGPETANNAAVGGSFVPTLALGIPGSGSAALLISALMLHGIRPGPMIFTSQPRMVFAIILGFLLTNIMFLFLGVFGTRYFGKLLEIPYFILFPIIIILTVIGSFALRNNVGDVVLMIAMGVFGYIFLEKGGFPVAPVILGLVLGGLMEANFRRAYLIAGDIRGIFTRPITGFIMVLSLIFLCYPLVAACKKKKKKR
jgi:putative tricarboxylic transport membrane protein